MRGFPSLNLEKVNTSDADHTAGWEMRTARARTRKQRASGERERAVGSLGRLHHAAQPVWTQTSGLHVRQAAMRWG